MMPARKMSVIKTHKVTTKVAIRSDVIINITTSTAANDSNIGVKNSA